MRLLRIRARAFTLLECLLAVLVISGSLLVFNGLSRSLSKDISYQTVNRDKDWLIFSEQLRQELDQSQLVKLENNHLYVKKDGQELAFGKSKSDDFRKTNWSGQGYQPMIQGLREANISLQGQLLRIDLVFENGMNRSFYHAMAETH